MKCHPIDWIARHEGTLKATLTTVIGVVLSKSWDVFLSKQLWPLALGLHRGSGKMSLHTHEFWPR